MDVGWKMCGREFDITWVEGFRNAGVGDLLVRCTSQKFTAGPCIVIMLRAETRMGSCDDPGWPSLSWKHGNEVRTSATPGYQGLGGSGAGCGSRQLRLITSYCIGSANLDLNLRDR